MNISERPENQGLARELTAELRKRKGVDFGPTLTFKLQQLLLDHARRAAMGRAAADLGHPGAASEIAATLLEVADG